MFKSRHASVLLLIIFCAFVFVSCNQDFFPKRTLQLKIVADETFGAHHRWERFAKEVVKEASSITDKQFGIKLEIKNLEKVKIECDTAQIDKQIKKLKPQLQSKSSIIVTDASLRLKLCGIRKAEKEIEWLKERVDYEDCDIIIYFSSKDYGIVVGYADYNFGAWALVVYRHGEENSFQLTLHTFIHEIGHLFGAVHTKDETFIMHRQISGLDVLKFDKFNKKLIFKNKWRDFKKQLKKKENNP